MCRIDRAVECAIPCRGQDRACDHTGKASDRDQSRSAAEATRIQSRRVLGSIAHNVGDRGPIAQSAEVVLEPERVQSVGALGQGWGLALVLVGAAHRVLSAIWRHVGALFWMTAFLLLVVPVVMELIGWIGR